MQLVSPLPLPLPCHRRPKKLSVTTTNYVSRLDAKRYHASVTKHPKRRCMPADRRRYRQPPNRAHLVTLYLLVRLPSAPSRLCFSPLHLRWPHSASCSLVDRQLTAHGAFPPRFLCTGHPGGTRGWWMTQQRSSRWPFGCGVAAKIAMRFAPRVLCWLRELLPSSTALEPLSRTTICEVIHV